MLAEVVPDVEDIGCFRGGLSERAFQVRLGMRLMALGWSVAPEFPLFRRGYRGGDPTAYVDLMAIQDSARALVIECKRQAPVDGLGQVLRYAEMVRQRFPGEEPIPILAAPHTAWSLEARMIVERAGVRIWDIHSDIPPPPWPKHPPAVEIDGRTPYVWG